MTCKVCGSKELHGENSYICELVNSPCEHEWGKTIELGEDHDGPYMYINYYFRHSQVNTNNPIKDKDFIYFISTLAYYFEIGKVLIFTDYTSCDIHISKKEQYQGGNYCTDIYNYLKLGKKRYDKFDSMVIKPIFSYYQLDRLKSIDPDKILSQYKDELYQIYKAAYKNTKHKQNLADFYIWLVDNYCVFTKDLVHKFSNIYTPENNPFNELNNSYILDTGAYLYNNRFIDQLPIFDKKSKIILKEKIDKRFPKNMYRTGYRHRRIIELK